ETTSDFLADPRLRPLTVGIVRELLAVALAQGVKAIGFPDFDVDAFIRGDDAAIDRSFAVNVEAARGSPKPRSGMWRDLAVRKRQTEVAAQFAPIQRLARQSGLATPIIDHMVALIVAIETGRREQGMALAEELLGTALAHAAVQMPA